MIKYIKPTEYSLEAMPIGTRVRTVGTVWQQLEGRFARVIGIAGRGLSLDMESRVEGGWTTWPDWPVEIAHEYYECFKCHAHFDDEIHYLCKTCRLA